MFHALSHRWQFGFVYIRLRQPLPEYTCFPKYENERTIGTAGGNAAWHWPKYCASTFQLGCPLPPLEPEISSFPKAVIGSQHPDTGLISCLFPRVDTDTYHRSEACKPTTKRRQIRDTDQCLHDSSIKIEDKLCMLCPRHPLKGCVHGGVRYTTFSGVKGYLPIS